MAAGTAHRAAALLSEWGMIDVRVGRRAVVLGASAAVELGRCSNGASQADEVVVELQTAAVAIPVAARTMVDLHVKHLGADFAQFSAEADLTDGAELRRLLLAAVRRRGGDPAQIDEYEMDVRRPSEPAAAMTFATSPV